MKTIKHLASICVLSAAMYAAPTLAEKTSSDHTPNEAAMKKMIELSTPGEHHKVLDALVGNWEYTMTYRAAEDAPEQTTKGTSENTWILDGRQLKQHSKSMIDMGGQKMAHEGIGFIGYDNITGKYTSIWMDNMGTGTFVATGDYDKAKHTIVETGQGSCAMHGKVFDFRSELTITDKDHITYTMYNTSDVDKPFKSLEINYTRQ